MKYTFEKQKARFYEKSNIIYKIYRVDENGNKELYMDKGSPVIYTYGMWADILNVGIENPGLQELIEKTIMYYSLLEKEK